MYSHDETDGWMDDEMDGLKASRKMTTTYIPKPSMSMMGL
jgi:hypothetical protein